MGVQVEMCEFSESHYSAITECLREVSEEGEKWSVQASGIHDFMLRMSFITRLVVFEEILRVIHVTYKALQSSNCTMSEAAALTDSLKAHFVPKRHADSWSDVWKAVKQFCLDNNIADMVIYFSEKLLCDEEDKQLAAVDNGSSQVFFSCDPSHRKRHYGQALP